MFVVRPVRETTKSHVEIVMRNHGQTSAGFLPFIGHSLVSFDGAVSSKAQQT
jgi:hypothetical protein